jgi:L-threonylcarbamoyladenylate synthase
VYDITDAGVVDAAMSDAAATLASGGLVAFPTETVYGLGANACDVQAVARIFAAKGRPQDNPLIVHLSDVGDIPEYVADFEADAARLAEVFMPGPLTLLLPKNGRIADNVTCGLASVGIRVPGLPMARRLIAEAGVPVAAPSANLSGRPSPTKGSHVIADLLGKVDVILAGQDCEVGLESTVLDTTVRPFQVLRPGFVGIEELSMYCDVVLPASPGPGGAPRSPGVKYTHYKPAASVVAIDMEPAAAAAWLEKTVADGPEVAALVFDEANCLVAITNKFSMGSYSQPGVAAHLLFSLFRECDSMGVATIYVMSPGPAGIGEACRNRLFRAADEVVG